VVLVVLVVPAVLVGRVALVGSVVVVAAGGLVAPGGRFAPAARPGMWVVQTCAPPASVASRCTWTPSSREKTSVSASHSCGKRAATCCTGQ
jgi:hypothetical protein